jgi:excisionase family DNA binding protein
VSDEAVETEVAEVMSEVMTVEDVAGYLRVNPATVYKLANTGQIPGMRLGRSWRFLRPLLDEWLENQMRVNVAAPGQENATAEPGEAGGGAQAPPSGPGTQER